MEDESNHLYFKTKSGKAKKRRVITTGLNGHAIEWNLMTSTPSAKLNLHSAIWDSKMHGKYLYAAQEDGSIKVIKVKKTKLELVRSLVKMDSRCLSLELEREVDEKSIVKSLFGGYADSSIRKWDLTTGNSVLHFEKGKKS